VRTNDLGLRHIEDGLSIGDTGWAWLRVQGHPYELLSEEGRHELLVTAARGLAALRTGECHLLIVNRTVSTAQWAGALEANTFRPRPGWGPYIGHLAEHIEGKALSERRVYLGIKLGDVRNRSGLSKAVVGAERLLGLRSPGAGNKDLRALRAEADLRYRTMLAAGARVSPVPDAELRWLVQRTVWRGIAEPPVPVGVVRGRGLALSLLDSTIVNGSRSLVVEQLQGRSALTSLTLAGVPEQIPFPGGEWLRLFDVLPFPVEASVRFEILPTREVRKDVDRRLASVRDQTRHISGTGAELPLELAESAAAARELEFAMEADQTPWVRCWPRFIVAAPDEGELNDRVIDLVEMYADFDLALVRPGGDQLALFMETIPGGRRRVAAYGHELPMVTFAGSMWGASSELGDRQGPFVGWATGHRLAPVGYDATRAAAANRENAVAITGAPGGGKSNLAYLQAAQLAMRGVSVMLIDPKEEATGLSRLPGLGRVQLLRLTDSYAGALDAFAIEPDRSRAALLAADLCRFFLPAELGRSAEDSILAAAGEESLEADPSTMGVVQRLLRSPEPDAQRAGRTLEALSTYPLARLCLARGTAKTWDLLHALTIIQFPGVSFPSASTRPEDYSVTDRLAVGLMFATTALTSRLIEAGEPGQPKAIIFDEAWAITRSSQGAALVDRLARTGRSKDTVLFLVTQSAADLLDERLKNNISVKFAFRAKDKDEALAVCRLLDLEETPEHVAVVRELGLQGRTREGEKVGECLFADLDGRVGRLRVDLVLPEWIDAFDTTPKRQPAVRIEDNDVLAAGGLHPNGQPGSPSEGRR
jgi:hypothetical protein